MSQTPGAVLKFVVVGSGLAGLSAAYALKKAGHNVLVLEKGNAPRNAGVTIACPPNMTRILKEWGIGEEFLNNSPRHTCTNFTDATDGKLIGALPSAIFDVVRKDSMADFLLLQRREFHDLLHNAGVREGVDVRFNSTVSKIEPLEGSTRVYLSNEESFETDVVVAADGPNSVIRRGIVASSSLSDNSKILLLRSTGPAKDLEQEGLIPTQVGKNVATLDLYLGDGFFCHGSAPAGIYALLCMFPYPGSLVDGKGFDSMEWIDVNEVPSYLQRFIFDNLSNQLQGILRRATSMSLRVHECCQPPESLVSLDARTVLVGEAAHTVSDSYHATALCIEDAQTLAYLFSRIQDKCQIPGFLTAYDEIRHPRATSMHANGKRREIALKAPKGPLQEMRDARIQAVLEAAERGEINEEKVMEEWGDHVRAIMYDATEKAEDWWLHLGSTVAKLPVRPRLSVSMSSFTREGSSTEA